MNKFYISKIRLLLLLILSFSLGFFFNFVINKVQNRPDSGSLNLKLLLKPQEEIKPKKAAADNFITSINYDGKQFKPRSAKVGKGNYITITNRSSTGLMWLVSDNPVLNTPRGYGEGEMLREILTEVGKYQVVNKLNPENFLVVEVIP